MQEPSQSENAPEPEASERQGQPWSEEEERKLYTAFVDGVGIEKCAEIHQRKLGGITSRLKVLGLIDDDGNVISPRPAYAPSGAVQKRNDKAIKVAEMRAARKEQEGDIAEPEINDRFREALHIIADTDASAFITGRAGTGKSTLLKYFCRNSKKRAVVLAPTGVAALNAGGQTIHGFFRFQIDITPEKVLKKKKPRNEKLYKKLQTIIIDEVSMVRADVLDCVETFLRMHGSAPGQPFGGVQMIFIGDLYQLPPVVTSADREIFNSHYKTPYFFSAHAMQDFALESIELEKVYRQKDADFLSLLNRVRDNSVSREDIEHLNSRLITNNEDIRDTTSITLTATNRLADEINQQHLDALKGGIRQSDAEVKGDFGREYFPTATELYYKPGARVMMLSNDREGRWVNGSLGTIEAVQRDADGKEYLPVRLDDEKVSVPVYRHTWEVYKFGLEGNQIVSEPVGTFIQYPFRLAWAVTIHKSQGKTFTHVIIDIGAGAFAAGQVYVALSRCTSFEGVKLRTPIRAQHIRTDPRIHEFIAAHRPRKVQAVLPDNGMLTLIESAIRDKSLLDIVYLKANDEKTADTVQPISLGDKTYQGKKFVGMKAWYGEEKEERLYSVDRILDIKKTGT